MIKLKTKKTILILSNEHRWTYNLRKEIIDCFLKNEYRVTLALPYGKRVETFKEMGCIYIDVPMFEGRKKNFIKDFQLLREYKKILSLINPDIVLTYTIKCNVYGGIACRLAHVPYIANVTGLGTAIENGGLLSKLAMILYKIGLGKAGCVFFQNRQNQKFFLDKKIVGSKTRLLPGSGVNLREYAPEPYPSDREGVRFLFVGRLMKDKGIEELLTAIREIKKEYPSARLDIVGGYDENYIKEIEEAEAENLVNYYGHQPGVHNFYKNAHCVVMPSYHEGMSNVMLEAASMGRPVITTRVPGCRETFEEGITGFGCEARDAESLTDAMRRFMSLTQDARAEMGLNGRRKMEKEFDRSLVVRAYLEEIERLASR